MPHILRTRKSREDYASIFDFIAESSPQNAVTILRAFDEKLFMLAMHPRMGKPRPELGENIRCWTVYRFVLFYRPIETGIALIRVLHVAMDIARQHFPHH